METHHRDILRKHRMTLCSGFSEKYDDVLESLVKMKILTVVDKEIVNSQSSTSKKCEKILDFLPKKGPTAFKTFVDVLSKNAFDNLVNLIAGENGMIEKNMIIGTKDNLDDSLSMKTVYDFNDGRPVLNEEKELEHFSGIKLDREIKEEELDSTDTPKTLKALEVEDGRFLFGAKKKDIAEVDSPGPALEESLNSEEIYSMKHLPRGKLLLINNKDFLPESGMAPYTRNGTDVDAASIKLLFEELGFIVEEHRNITVYEIRKAFKKAGISDYSKMSAFAACVLSHGQEGIVYGIDGTIDIKEITAYFRGQNLAGKPKMFFFQACQGSEYMDAVEQLLEGDETDGPPVYGNEVSLPTEADFLYAYSTVPGYYSWRNSTKGSWFIQAIVEVFRQYAHKMDVVRMLTRVNQIVSTKKSQTGQRQSHHKRQISSIISQLRKEVYLSPPHGPLKRCTSVDY